MYSDESSVSPASSSTPDPISRRGLLKAGSAGALAMLCPSLARADAGSAGAKDQFQGQTLTIFHAGSLSPAFKQAEKPFAERYGVEINEETKGSVASTKKITQLGRHADVLAVSDYRLLRDRLLPDHGGWYAIFATNAMTIQYRPDAPGADEISTDNWWKVLSRQGVRIGHSDPAVDPGGYRAVMTMQLGKIPFQGQRLYGQQTFKKLQANSIVPTGTEINLSSQLQAGKLDYVFYYRSISATSGLPYVGLQRSVDLSKATPDYARHYAKAEVNTQSGNFTGAPIAYGVAVPENAEHPALGARWVAFLLSDAGNKILKNAGFVPVRPAVVAAADKHAVPAEVMRHAKAQSALGPLKL